MSLRSKDLKWFEIDPAFGFHVMNAYEQGDNIVLDVARYEQLWVNGSSDFDDPARLSRYTLGMNSGASSLQEIGPQRLEFPQINRRLTGRSYRYGYSLWIMDAHNISNVLARVQLHARVPQGFHGLWLPMEQLQAG